MTTSAECNLACLRDSATRLAAAGLTGGNPKLLFDGQQQYAINEQCGQGPIRLLVIVGCSGGYGQLRFWADAYG